MDKYHVKLTFTQPVLGTIPKNKEVYAEYIAGKAALTDDELAEELNTVENVERQGWTGFHELDGNPILYDYAIKGFFKEACGMLRRATGTHSSKVQAFKKIVDGLVFVTPRQIPLCLNGGRIEALERPLRAQTAQGERVALARSDTCPVGTTMEFGITILGAVPEALLREWLDYGALHGLGQWRSGGYGSFAYEMEKVA